MRAWREMSQEEYAEEMEAGREEGHRRMEEIARLLGAPMPTGKPGRPPKNAAYRFGGADPEKETDAASAVEALRD